MQTAREALDKRFAAVSLDHPINALLHDLALRNLETSGKGSVLVLAPPAAMPNAVEYLELKTKANLLPIETIKDRIKLPSLPDVVFKLQHAIEAGASSSRIAEIIRYDPKLTAAILSLVNSPIFALPGKVESLERAVTLIGTREVSSLALGARLLAMFEETVPQGLPLNAFWMHSIACAVLAHDIATLRARPEPEKYMVAGLLHDLGKVMLYSHSPQLGHVAFALEQEQRRTLHEVELELFDVDHCMVGGIFFSEWGLPEGVIQSALYHHDPEKCVGKAVPEVVYVANQIATALGMSCSRLYTLDPGEEVWAALGIEADTLHPLIERVDQRLWTMFCSLFPASDLCRK
jgi:HD-like signal output (HDOD) protein